ncbi:hypothetical protein ACFFKH_15580 [Micromonospora marina]|uniref:Uncharacterized protein n=1 Tax=Micromonospora marina TaxID=307120 RepID=A0A1C4VF03_9ACTN|nr:hypothetical protein [Micromonospora marina]SCE82275.1 hypothetical protein GA0070215_103106 [Micromonospora marina]
MLPSRTTPGRAAVRSGQRGAAQPDGPGALRWQMRYRVLDDSDRLVREVTAAYRWFLVSPEAIVAELTAAGFDATPGPMDIVRAEVR